MYSSYNIKLYTKSMGGSAGNSIVEKLAFLGSKGPPLEGGGHFSMVEIFSNLVFLVMHPEYIIV